MDTAVTQLRVDGFEARDEDAARLSLCVRHHTNVLGRHSLHPAGLPTCRAACGPYAPRMPRCFLVLGGLLLIGGYLLRRSGLPFDPGAPAWAE